MTDESTTYLLANHEPTNGDSPGEAIVRALSLNPDTIVNTSIGLMESLADVMVGTLGVHGFETLLSRSAHVVTRHFPWFEYDRHSRFSDPEFESLRRCFESQDRVQARLASNLLFNSFIYSLTLCIGEHLTATLLHIALERAGAEKNSRVLGNPDEPDQ